jgi:hypothetical protein
MTGPAFIITSLVHTPLWWGMAFLPNGTNTQWVTGSGRQAVWAAVNAQQADSALAASNPLVSGDTQQRLNGKKSHFPYNIGHYDFVEVEAGSPNQCKKRIPVQESITSTASGQTEPSITIDDVLWWITTFTGGRQVGMESTY